MAENKLKLLELQYFAYCCSVFCPQFLVTVLSILSLHSLLRAHNHQTHNDSFFGPCVMYRALVARRNSRLERDYLNLSWPFPFFLIKAFFCKQLQGPYAVIGAAFALMYAS